MTGDLVVGLDSSTQSTKAIAWNREGHAVAEGRADIPMASPHPGWAEQDVADWWQAATTALNAVTAAVDPSRIAGLAISNQRETVAFVDDDLKAIRPAMVWLDERAMSEVEGFTKLIGKERLHTISGKPADVTPVVYRLAWMRRHAAEDLDRTAKLLDVHGFISGKLTGTATASWTSADPFGVFDIEAKRWSEPVLHALYLSADRFGPLAKPATAIGEVHEIAAAATGLRPGTPVYAAGGDGQCAGLGVDAVRPGIVYLNLGTAIITGAWAPTPQIDLAWRTMTSPTGDGYFLEGVQRAGAFFVNWFIDAFAGGRTDPRVFERLEAEAASLPVGAEGVVVCPYLSGCMDPHWDPAARASFQGLSSHHGVGHVYRACLEALTLESARCIQVMDRRGLAPNRIMAVGGGANSAFWCRMLADATGLPLTVSHSLEASALGAGISAAVGAGWYGGFADAAQAMCRDGATTDPDPAMFQAWQALSTRQAAAYRPQDG